MRRVIFNFYFFSERAARGGGGVGGGAARFFLFLFPVQQTTSGIGHRVKQFFRVGNQCAKCEIQQQQQKLLQKNKQASDWVDAEENMPPIGKL